jgi:hypothetical protein
MSIKPDFKNIKLQANKQESDLSKWQKVVEQETGKSFAKLYWNTNEKIAVKWFDVFLLAEDGYKQYFKKHSLQTFGRCLFLFLHK